MHTISIPDAITLIDHVAFKMREPIMMWGQPGVGKSEMTHLISTQHSATMVDIRLSQYDSVDMRGIPNVQNRTAMTC